MSERTSEQSEERVMTSEDEPVTAGPLTMIRGLAWDVGLPVATYYVLHLLGFDDWIALLGGSVVAALRIVWVAVRHRRLNPFATVMLVVYGAGFALAFATGEPRTLLLRNSLITGVLGLVFLWTAICGRRPLTLSALQSFQPAQAAQVQAEFDTDADVRRGHRFSSTVWGVGLLAEALIRIPLVFLLPVSVAVGLTEALLIVTLVGLAAWNAWWVRRASRR
ncbi:hypothetical protein GCM10009836_63760 [Pseudonocardia ailaonensis]|uniref:DUF3159 domain-containing protein n=1 Tax=Pseudonocardia ailaonensis TaxID=367279 RepID=A0ABN2NL21_9PSEU